MRQLVRSVSCWRVMASWRKVRLRLADQRVQCMRDGQLGRCWEVGMCGGSRRWRCVDRGGAASVEPFMCQLQLMFQDPNLFLQCSFLLL